MSNQKHIVFKLYVLQGMPTGDEIDRITTCLNTVLGDTYELEIIDLADDPEIAEDAQILAIPTLVRETPSPNKRLIGDLSHQEKVFAAFQS